MEELLLSSETGNPPQILSALDNKERRDFVSCAFGRRYQFNHRGSQTVSVRSENQKTGQNRSRKMGFIPSHRSEMVSQRKRGEKERQVGRRVRMQRANLLLEREEDPHPEYRLKPYHHLPQRRQQMDLNSNDYYLSSTRLPLLSTTIVIGSSTLGPWIINSMRVMLCSMWTVPGYGEEIEESIRDQGSEVVAQHLRRLEQKSTHHIC
ncbi:hypothetical protein ACH5RR_009965 [Cinchona calisaya]|uniref:Uncharacterized protein n=1 Tax=Cinchona calisaya TaxID=153742 RepID=A0ABD3AIJ1_9GENT